MKLLTEPTATIEDIELSLPETVLETKFSTLGLFGIGPLFKTREVTKSTRSVTFAGRAQLARLDIDMEGVDPYSIFTEPDKRFGYRKVNKAEGWTFEFQGNNYTLFGILPLYALEYGGTVYCCAIDRFLHLGNCDGTFR